MKLGKGMLFALSMLVTLALGNPFRVQAAGGATMIPDSSIRVNYEYEYIEVDAGTNTEIYYSDSAVATNWEIAPIRGGKARFDISWIKPGTTTRIYIKGNQDQVVTARYLYAQESLSVEFVGDLSAADVVDIETWKTQYESYPMFSNDTGYVLFFIKNAGVGTAYFDLDTIEWRKGDNGNWKPFEELDLATMNAKGANLQFRIKAVNDEDTADKLSGKRFSSTAKLTLQKTAAAPVVSVNSATMSLSIRNGMEYSLNKKDWNLVPTYDRSATGDSVVVPVVSFDILPVTNKRITTLAVPMVLNVVANQRIDKDMVLAAPTKYTCAKDEGGEIIGIYVYVRTAASSKKAASKMTEIMIPFTKGVPDIANDITVEYQQSKTGTSGVTLINNTTTMDPVDYQYAIVEDPYNLTPEELSEVKWSSLRASKTVKVGNSKALTNYYLIFRVVTSGRNELPSEYEIYPYPIVYDKVSFAALSTTSLFPGGEITATTSNNPIAGTITYRWERSQTITGTYTEITTGTGYEASKYTIREEDIGYYIRVVISNVSASGEKAEVTSKNTGKIAQDPTKK